MMGQALAVRSSSSVISFAGRMKLKRGHCRPSLSNQGSGCCGRRRSRSAHFIGVVAMLRFGSLLWAIRREVAFECVREVRPLVALRGLGADANSGGRDAVRRQQTGEAIGGDRLAMAPLTYRPRDRACLCRQGIPRPRCPKPAPRLHLRPKTRGLRPHQTRAQTARRHRGGDRTYMKAEGHLGRCYLKGRAGDAANVILSAVGYNLRLVLLALLQAFAIRLYKPDF